MENSTAGEFSLAFENRGGKLVVKVEDRLPYVKLNGQSYFVTEAPSVTVGDRKFFVEEIV